MNLPEWKKTARIIKEAYRELEVEAVDSGVDIFSDEFQEAKGQIRSKILAQLGYTEEEYKIISDSMVSATKQSVKRELQKTQAQIEELQKVENLTAEDVMKIAHSVASTYITAPQIIHHHEIVKEITVKEPTIVKETIVEEITKRVEYDPTFLLERLESFAKDIVDIKASQKVELDVFKEEFHNDFGENFNKNINIMDMPDWRKLAMGLQGQIDQISNTISTLGSTLNAVSLASTDAAKSLYQMTSGVDVEFRNSVGTSLLKLFDTNRQVVVGVQGTQNLMVAVDTFGVYRATSQTATTNTIAKFTNEYNGTTPGTYTIGYTGANYFSGTATGSAGTFTRTANGGSFMGMRALVTINGAVTATKINPYTGRFAFNDTATITDAAVINVEASTLTTGTNVTNLYGLWINGGTTVAGAGVLTNNYGIKIDDVGAGTNKWGLYQTSTTNPNYFAGSVGIGIPLPTSPLHVVSTLTGGFGINASITTSGSAAAGGAPGGMQIILLPGYTGSGVLRAAAISSTAASTGVLGWTNAAGAVYGIFNTVSGVSSGHNVGNAVNASGSATLNLGFNGRAVSSTNSPALNVAISGFALNGTTASVAGFFGLMSTAPTLGTSAALIADNGSTGFNIFQARVNGIATTVIDGTGRLGVMTETPTVPLHVLGNTSGSGSTVVTAAILHGGFVNPSGPGGVEVDFNTTITDGASARYSIPVSYLESIPVGQANNISAGSAFTLWIAKNFFLATDKSTARYTRAITFNTDTTGIVYSGINLTEGVSSTQGIAITSFEASGGLPYLTVPNDFTTTIGHNLSVSGRTNGGIFATYPVVAFDFWMNDANLQLRSGYVASVLSTPGGWRSAASSSDMVLRGLLNDTDTEFGRFGAYGAGINSTNYNTSFTVRQKADITNLAGTTTANASTTITGSGTAFRLIAIGDRISLSSASSTYATVTAIARDTSLTVSAALGNGTTQTINVKKALFSLIDNSGALKVVVNDQGNLGIDTTTPVQKVDVNGNIQMNTAGNGLYIKEGSNATMGTATLSAGTVVVSTTKVTANSRIFLTVNGGTLTNVGAVYVSARTAGTSFTITSLNILDASNVAWAILEPSP